VKCTCVLPKRLPERVISLYRSKFVDKEEMLRTVSNPDNRCSSDKVDT
jgi:hypothetical protein